MNRWKSAARYVELIEGWILDTGAGYIAIRKANGINPDRVPDVLRAAKEAISAGAEKWEAEN